MAFFSEAIAPRPAVIDRISSLVNRLKSASRRRVAYARTRDALRGLDDRQLEDMGISRGMIADAAFKAIYQDDK